MKTLRFTVLMMLGLLLLPLFAKADGALIRTTDGQIDVISVDRWETQFRTPIEGLYIGGTPVAYLQRIIETKIRPINATFAANLESGLMTVLRTEWIDAPDLQLMKPKFSVKGNYQRDGWARTQLLVRDSNGIRYNKALFSRLHNFDIALILLDEAVYSMSSKIERKDDNYEVRRLVAKLLAVDTLGVEASDLVQDQQKTLNKALVKELRRVDRDLENSSK